MKCPRCKEHDLARRDTNKQVRIECPDRDKCRYVEVYDASEGALLDAREKEWRKLATK